MLERLDLTTLQRAELEEATARYVDQLDEPALAYLRGRGLEDAAPSFRLGVVRDPLPEHRSYVGRLAVPYLTPNGVVSMRFRALDDSKIKMLGPAGVQPRMFNVNALHTRLPYVAIVEGEFDAMAADLIGLPAVGIPGTSMWHAHFPRIFADFETVYVITDNDVKAPNEDGETPVNAGQELACIPVEGAQRHGQRPPRLTPRGRPAPGSR